jgi:hypothetical protein
VQFTISLVIRSLRQNYFNSLPLTIVYVDNPSYTGDSDKSDRGIILCFTLLRDSIESLFE